MRKVFDGIKREEGRATRRASDTGVGRQSPMGSGSLSIDKAPSSAQIATTSTPIGVEFFNRGDDSRMPVRSRLFSSPSQ